MTDIRTEPTAVVETDLTHKMHRAATTLLTEAAGRPSVPAGALAELRDFLVANLHHHHESEDGQLWPLITAAAPETAAELAALSEDHDLLDTALDALAGVPIGDTGRAALAEAASAVRDLVHDHLEREEPLLFPALRAHVSPEAWAEFSQQVVATAPMEGAHLMIGLFDEVGSPEEVELVLSGLPEQARAFVPGMRQAARGSLAVLRGENDAT
ncbi:hypothetical protein GCM10009530_36120 [Microbispora corallina]|uniref:Hemerythrin-like domain-containing protein n=1 Tax=Microbispora corallina TaxID=83302 RepID=A0ABQ4FYF5_9ACTN|nr:hemerythrin domain-containing protein [Microbispora corallina]GIH39851.1 hypothetical protein Mco01_28510 [Microbispora corallina]